MKLLADECCDLGLVEALRRDGHDVLFAVEEMQGAIDEVILARAFDEDRLLLTEDKDFGELVYRLSLSAQGIVLLRFGPREHAIKINRLLDLLKEHAARLMGSFVVLEADKIRFRPLN